MKKYEKVYNEFVKEIAQILIDDGYIIVEYLANAVDGLDANGWDIQTIINIYSHERFNDTEIFEKPYYIKKLLSNRSTMNYDNNYISEIIMDIIWDELDNNETYNEMFNDLYDINSISNKYDYGGGGYEFKLKLINDIVKEVMIKCQNNKVKESIHIKGDKIILESLIAKYGAKGVEVAINRLNENINMGIKLSNILKTTSERNFNIMYDNFKTYFENFITDYVIHDELPRGINDKIYIAFDDNMIYYGSERDVYVIKWRGGRAVNYNHAWWAISFGKNIKCYEVPNELRADVISLIKTSKLDPSLKDDYYSAIYENNKIDNVNRLNDGVDKSIMDEVNELCDLFRKYGVHRISNEDPKYKDAINNLVKQLPIYDKISNTHPHVWFTYSKTSYWRDPIVINLHYWVKGSNSSTYCSIYELGEEAAKLCIYTLQTIFDKIEHDFDEYRTHPEMEKVIKEISDILKAASVKYGNYLVSVKERGDNSYKFTLMENNKHQWPVGWLYVSENDNGGLYISHGWPLGGQNIGRYCSWEKAKEYAHDFVRATFN